MEPNEADKLLAVTLTTERTVLLPLGEMRELLGQPAVTAAEVISLVEDTDAYHEVIRRALRFDSIEVHESFTVQRRW